MATTDGLRYVDSDGHILEHPTGDARLRAGGVPGPHLAHRDRRRRRGVAPLQRQPHAGERHVGRRHRRVRATRTGRARSAASCATPRRVPRRGTPRRACRTWTRTTSTSPCCTRRCSSACRASTTSTSPRRRPARTTTGARTTCRRARAGCSVPARCRRCTSPTTSARVAAEIRRVASCPAWCRCSCGRTLRSTGGRSTTRSTTRSGRPRPTPACPIALHPFLAPDLPGACVGSAPGAPDARQRPLRRRLRPRPARRGRGRPLAASCFTQAIANPFDVMSSHRVTSPRAACASASPTPSSSSWRRTAAGSCRGSSASTTTAASTSGRSRTCRCCRRSTSAGSAGSASTPTRRCSAMTARSPLVGADRIIWASDYPHPDAKFPGVTEELAEALEGLTSSRSARSPPTAPLALYGIR